MSVGEGRRISDLSGRKVAITWVLTSIWCAISAPLLWLLPAESAQGNHAALLGLLFPLIGVGLIAFALRETVRHQRYGSLRFEPDPDPALVGGALGGRIQLPVRVESERDVEVVLTCWRTRVTARTHDEGSSTDTEQSVFWQREGRPLVQSAAAGSLLLFRFDLPAGLPASSDSGAQAGDSTRWELTVTVRYPGVALERSFDVPVALNGPRPSAAIAALPEASSYGPPPQIPQSVVRITRDGGAVEFVYPPGRDRGAALMLALFGLICIGAVVFLHDLPGTVTTSVGGLSRSRPTDAMPAWVIAVMLAMGTLLSGLSAFMLGNTLRVRATSTLLSARRSVFGIGLWERSMPRTQVGDIVPQIAITHRGGGRPRITYRLHAVPVEAVGMDSSAVMRARREGRAIGRKLLVGVSLNGSMLAERVRGELRRALGMKE